MSNPKMDKWENLVPISILSLTSVQDNQLRLGFLSALAHGWVVSLVGVQLLLNQLSQLQVLLVVAVMNWSDGNWLINLITRTLCIWWRDIPPGWNTEWRSALPSSPCQRSSRRLSEGCSTAGSCPCCPGSRPGTRGGWRRCWFPSEFWFSWQPASCRSPWIFRQDKLEIGINL